MGDTMKEIGQRLKDLRKNLHLTQTQMADILEIKQSSIAKYEQGMTAPSVELLRKYADYFDVSLDYIFARTDDPQGKLYENKPKLLAEEKEMQRLVEMCFAPESLFQAKLKQTLLQMLEGAQK